MTGLLPVLRAELLKTRRTLALWLTVLAPLLLALLQSAVLFDSGRAMAAAGNDPWDTLVRNGTTLWCILALPMFIALETALTAGIEHGSQSWKWLFALPVRRSTYYLAKTIANLVLVGLSSVAIALTTVATGLLLRVVLPGIGFERAIPWATIVQGGALAYVASLFVVTVHTWVGLRWSSFVVAMGVGIAVTLAAVMAVNSEYIDRYPWTWAAYTAGILREEGRVVWTLLGASALGAVAATLAGMLDFSLRDAA